nr:DUF4157 domain-containing protein [Portibacter lacus]
MASDFSISTAPTSQLKKLNAQAYTQGNQVYMPENADTSSSKTQFLMAHEISHAIQNQGGAPKPTQFKNGRPINDDSGVEKEADHNATALTRQLKTDDFSQIYKAKFSNASTQTDLPIQRKPDRFEPTADEKKRVKDFKITGVHRPDYAEQRDKFIADLKAEILRNINSSRSAILFELANLDKNMEGIQRSAATASKSKNVVTNLLNTTVGEHQSKGTRMNVRHGVSFNPNQKPEIPMTAKTGKHQDEWSRVNATYKIHDEILNKKSTENPVLFGAIKSHLGSLEKLASPRTAKQEASKILNLIIEACDETKKNLKGNNLKLTDFKPVIQKLKQTKWKANTDIVDGYISIESAKDTLWNYGKFGTNLILSLGAAFTSGGTSLILGASALAMDVKDAKGSIDKYYALKAASQSPSEESNKIVNNEDVQMAKVDMIFAVGGTIVGVTGDGTEIFKQAKTMALNAKIARNASHVPIYKLTNRKDMIHAIKASGGWKNLAKKTDKYERIQSYLMDFRDKEFDLITEQVEKWGGRVSRTGSTVKITSDLDASVLGDKSTAIREKVYKWMQSRYGLTTKKEAEAFFDMGLFGESKLKYAYKSLSKKSLKTVKNNQQYLENGMVLNRLLKEAKDSGNVQEVARYQKLLKDGGMEEYAFKKLNEKEIKILNNEIDDFYKKLNAASDEVEKVRCVTEIQKRLTLVDISDPASYHTGAGVFAVNAGRKQNKTEDFLWATQKQKKGIALTTDEKNSVLMGHFSAYGEYIIKFAKNPNDPDVIRSLGKYGDRICDAFLDLSNKGKNAKKFNELKEYFNEIKAAGDTLREGGEIKNMDHLQNLLKNTTEELNQKLEVKLPEILNTNLKSISKKSKNGLPEAVDAAKLNGQMQNYLRFKTMYSTFKTSASITTNKAGTEVVKSSTKKIIEKNATENSISDNTDETTSTSKSSKKIKTITPSLGGTPSYDAAFIKDKKQKRNEKINWVTHSGIPSSYKSVKGKSYTIYPGDRYALNKDRKLIKLVRKKKNK